MIQSINQSKLCVKVFIERLYAPTSVREIKDILDRETIYTSKFLLRCLWTNLFAVFQVKQCLRVAVEAAKCPFVACSCDSVSRTLSRNLCRTTQHAAPPIGQHRCCHLHYYKTNYTLLPTLIDLHKYVFDRKTVSCLWREDTGECYKTQTGFPRILWKI